MPLVMDMGLGAGQSYGGPLYSSAADVPVSGGYPDTTALAFGPDGMTSSAGSAPAKHATVFGVACFIGLIIFWWTLPR